MEGHRRRNHPRVLLVDDQAEVRQVLHRALDRTGRYAIAEAASADEAIEVIESDPPDAVILDISMPDGPGLSVISRVRAETTAIKILVLSSHFDMGADVVAMGADVFLPKTASARTVMGTLAHLLRS